MTREIAAARAARRLILPGRRETMFAERRDAAGASWRRPRDGDFRASWPWPRAAGALAAFPSGAAARMRGAARRRTRAAAAGGRRLAATTAWCTALRALVADLRRDAAGPGGRRARPSWPRPPTTLERAGRLPAHRRDAGATSRRAGGRRCAAGPLVTHLVLAVQALRRSPAGVRLRPPGRPGPVAAAAGPVASIRACRRVARPALPALLAVRAGMAPSARSARTAAKREGHRLPVARPCGALDDASAEPARRQAAVQAETCDDCGHYLKILHADRDPWSTPWPTTWPRVTLDLLVAETGPAPRPQPDAAVRRTRTAGSPPDPEA